MLLLRVSCYDVIKSERQTSNCSEESSHNLFMHNNRCQFPSNSIRCFSVVIEFWLNLWKAFSSLFKWFELLGQFSTAMHVNHFCKLSQSQLSNNCGSGWYWSMIYSESANFCGVTKRWTFKFFMNFKKFKTRCRRSLATSGTFFLSISLVFHQPRTSMSYAASVYVQFNTYCWYFNSLGHVFW